MNCKWCNELITSAPYRAGIIEKVVMFCDDKCLNEYVDEYMSDNWRDYGRLMGARIVE